MIRIYRVHQLLHEIGIGEAKHLTGIGVAISACIQISTLYLIVGHYSDINEFILLTIVVMFFTACMTFAKCLRMASQLRGLSKVFQESFLHNEMNMSAVM